MTKTATIFFIFMLIAFSVYAQKENPFIRLTDPLTIDNITSSSQHFIVGSTCKTCKLTINDTLVYVYPTGAFAIEVDLASHDSTFLLRAVAPSGKEKTQKVSFVFRKPKPEIPVTGNAIERIQTFPDGDLWLKPGDPVSVRVKATPGMQVLVQGDTRLYEMQDTIIGRVAGIYQGKYIIKNTDSFKVAPLQVSLISGDSINITKLSRCKFTTITPDMPDILITKGRLAHLLYGIGDDRLGGAKIGYIDSMIPLRMIGKVGSDYKVRLAQNRTAYIPDEHVNFLPKGTFGPSSLTGKIKAYHNGTTDIIQLQLFSRLPYQSFQETEPAAIVVDVFGATANTNWIDQLENLQEVKRVTYEQIADEIFRIRIVLRHHQHWGHSLYYDGNNLIISIKPQPKNLQLEKMTIAVDAGHGGSNTGAGGPTGSSEKNIALDISKKIKQRLEDKGARVIMTRDEEMFFDNKERILFYRDSVPDLLISVHLNSSADPIHVSGTSTFYRYEGFRPLSNCIYKRMLELGLKEYGNNGSFNFMLNSPTEYPNALVETLFLSNPEEEMKALDQDFQQRMAEKIVTGVEDFLKTCRD
jgi:N-acetylmuramoyl-L-alanine amidase